MNIDFVGEIIGGEILHLDCYQLKLLPKLICCYASFMIPLKALTGFGCINVIMLKKNILINENVISMTCMTSA